MKKLRSYKKSDDIGQQMLKFMLSANGKNPILFVAKSNTQAKEIYRKQGFTVVDEFETKYNGKVVMANRMEKSIENR